MIDCRKFAYIKIELQYLSDNNGKTQAVQIPITEWEKLLNKLRKYEQAIRLKSDLDEAYKEVAKMKIANKPKQTLTDFLNEL